MKSIVEVKDLTVSYNGKIAINNISFSIKENQIIGVIGPNGAGKSTLLKAIIGLLNVDKGMVTILDQPINKIRHKIAYVAQRNAIDFDFPVLVEDVVMMGRYPHIAWWKFSSIKDQQIVKDCLEKVGMFEHRKKQIGQLSGGQQQRVFIARALAQEADILFLDEPFLGIDTSSESMIMKILKHLRDQGKTLFVVHHDLTKAQTYFDSIIILNNNLIDYGEKEKVLNVDTIEKVYNNNKMGGCNKLMAVNS